VTRLSPTDVAANDAFGATAAISGSTAVIGAPTHAGAGAAYVFDWTGTAWVLRAELTAPDGVGGDGFGTAVAIAKSTIVVGAPHHTGGGRAYVFGLSSGTWTFQAELSTPAPTRAAGFGIAVAVRGSTIVVGAPNQKRAQGDAFVFSGTGGTWTETASLSATDGAQGDGFGWAISMSGSTVLVAAPGHDSSKGAAYVFVGSGPTWQEDAELRAPDAATGDEFGSAVSISGDAALIGAWRKGSDTGTAYLFINDHPTWSFWQTLVPSDPAPGNAFGSSVAIYSSFVLIGADFENSLNGAAYFFTNRNGSWSQRAKILPPDGGLTSFGAAVAV
jgi:FG-GAP repeat